MNQWLQIVRGFDGILYGSVAIFVLAAQPALGRNELGNFEMWYVFPVMVTAWFCLKLPTCVGGVSTWRSIAIRLRFLSAALITLAPFAVWWFNAPANTYLFINMLILGIVGIAFLYHLNSLVFAIAAYANFKALVWQSRMVKFVIFYLLFLPFVTLVASYFADCYISSSRNFMDAYTLILLAPRWLHWSLLFPLFCTIITLFHLRAMLARNYKPLTQVQAK